MNIHATIITYKSLTGDYSNETSYVDSVLIITYKSLTGDYSDCVRLHATIDIITYKSLTGDYSIMEVNTMNDRS